MDDFPSPFGYDDLHSLRDELVRDARRNGNSPAMVDYYLTEFVHRVEDAMNNQYTVFYQP